MATQSQINTVRNLQRLFNIEGRLSDEACANYIEWHQDNCSAEARGIKSVAAAIAGADGSMIDQQEKKLRELVR